jgi:predicted XRE-type DNA-binding protein
MKTEKEINDAVKEGKIRPVFIPRIKTVVDIVKFELCSEIIRYKKDMNLKQVDIAEIVGLDKSEVSRIFSYQLAEFSSDRLIGIIEALNDKGAEIRFETIFAEIEIKVALLNKKKKSYRKNL